MCSLVRSLLLYAIGHYTGIDDIQGFVEENNFEICTLFAINLGMYDHHEAKPLLFSDCNSCAVPAILMSFPHLRIVMEAFCKISSHLRKKSKISKVTTTGTSSKILDQKSAWIKSYWLKSMFVSQCRCVLETNKPYLMNTMRVPALQTCTLFSNCIDSNANCTRFVFT